MKKKLFSEIPVLEGERITLRPLTVKDADGLRELTEDPEVYRYLPTFLFEKKYEDPVYVIEHLYDECLKDSLILGIFLGEDFCGLAELYGYREKFRKASVGYRLVRRHWGQGIATEVLGLLVNYAQNEIGLEILTASVMVENKASANVLKKNRFVCVVPVSLEDWGYPKPVVTGKWLLVGKRGLREYRFQT